MTLTNEGTGRKDCISLKDVRVVFPSKQKNRPDVVALDQLEFSVKDNEFVTVVGPSGCGKSTLLYVVEGLRSVTQGEVSVLGKNVTGPGPDRALVFQNASLFPWRTIMGNVRYGLKLRGVPRDKAIETAQRIIELVGLKGFERHFPHELSGGMQQRVNLARALAVDPDVLLLDEPFSALDAQTREYMQNELTKIWRLAQKTALFVTHDIGEAVFLADRVLVLTSRPGRVRADIRIELPRPRTLAMKRSVEFLAYVEQIWELIEDEVKKTGMVSVVEDETAAAATGH